MMVHLRSSGLSRYVSQSSRETLNFRDGDKLYFSIWYEDPDYREETLVRSAQDGTILERFSGDIRIMPNRERWLIK